MQRFCGFLLCLFLTVGTGSVTAAEPLWELRPYRIEVLLAPDASAAWTPARLEALARDLTAGAQNTIGAPWQLEVTIAPPAVSAATQHAGLKNMGWPVAAWSNGSSGITPGQIRDWSELLKKLALEGPADAKTPVGCWWAAWTKLVGAAELKRLTAGLEAGDLSLRWQCTNQWNRLLADPALAATGDRAPHSLLAALGESVTQGQPELKQLLALPAESRTPLVVRRINRLLVEATFPEDLIPSAPYHKVIVLTLREKLGEQFLVGQEFDIATAGWGPLVTRPVRGGPELARVALQVVADAFTPLALVDRIEGEKVVIRPRAVALPIRDPRAAAFRNGSALRLVQPAEGRPSRSLSGTFLQVEQVGAAQAICRVWGQADQPLAPLRGDPRSWLACQVSAAPTSTHLDLVSATSPGQPLAGYNVLMLQPNKTWSSIGRTDDAGRVTLPATDSPLVQLTIADAAGPLARIPVLTGWQPLVQVRLPVDGARLAAELLLADLQSATLEAIARQEVQIARVAARQKAQQPEAADTLLKEWSAEQTQVRTKLLEKLEKQKLQFAEAQPELAKQLEPALDQLVALATAQLDAKRLTNITLSLKPPAPLAPDGWQVLRPSETEFAVFLPLEVKPESHNWPLGGATLKAEGWATTAAAPQPIYAVYYYDVPAGGDPATQLTEAATVLKPRFAVTVEKQEPVELPAAPAAKASEAVGTVDGRRFRLRAIVLENRVHLLLAIADEAGLKLPEVDTFLASFQPPTALPTAQPAEAAPATPTPESTAAPTATSEPAGTTAPAATASP